MIYFIVIQLTEMHPTAMTDVFRNQINNLKFSKRFHLKIGLACWLALNQQSESELNKKTIRNIQT